MVVRVDVAISSGGLRPYLPLIYPELTFRQIRQQWLRLSTVSANKNRLALAVTVVESDYELPPESEDGWCFEINLLSSGGIAAIIRLIVL